MWNSIEIIGQHEGLPARKNTNVNVSVLQDLRELGEHVMPLSCVRAFINIGGGPTPRDAVLLKTLLVIHEGIAWATGCPYYT